MLICRKIINFAYFTQIRKIKIYEKLISTDKSVNNIEIIRKMEGDLKARPNPIVTKLDSPELKSIFTNELKTLIELFAKYNHEIRIAGGAVRDILMNIQPKDVDFATTATPNEMKEMFDKENIRMINMKGEKHGTITPRINDKENFEVTTLRIDVLTDGRHAEVQFTTNWQLDANRRDLTFNSMFLGFDGSVYDYFYGYEDLQNRKVVFVGNPETRIKEDFLRILRYFRFYGKISINSNAHDENIIKAIAKNIAGLEKVSGERIWSEVKKILQGNFALDNITKMIECGIAKYIGLPEIPNIDELNRVFKNCENFENDPLNSISFMAALLWNTDDAITLHGRLKLSAYERDLALFISANREKLLDVTDIWVFKKLSLQPYAMKEFIEELLKYHGKKEIFNEFKKWKCPSFKINGDMLSEKGCPRGKSMGLVMKKLKSIWAENKFETSPDDLLNIHLPQILDEITTSEIFSKKKIKVTK